MIDQINSDKSPNQWSSFLAWTEKRKKRKHFYLQNSTLLRIPFGDARSAYLHNKVRLSHRDHQRADGSRENQKTASHNLQNDDGDSPVLAAASYPSAVALLSKAIKRRGTSVAAAPPHPTDSQSAHGRTPQSPRWIRSVWSTRHRCGLYSLFHWSSFSTSKSTDSESKSGTEDGAQNFANKSKCERARGK